jgi:hypothetical protein
MILDTLAYGYFSNYTGWLKFNSIIQAKHVERVRIQMLFYNKQLRQETLTEQFFCDEQEGWHEWRCRDDIKMKMETFLSHFPVGINRRVTAEAVEFPHFLEMLERAQARAADDFIPICRDQQQSPLEVGSHFRMYAWIVDGREAVFAVPSYFGEHSEYGFITRDKGLIQALEAMFEKIQSQNNRLNQPPLVNA